MNKIKDFTRYLEVKEELVTGNITRKQIPNGTEWFDQDEAEYIKKYNGNGCGDNFIKGIGVEIPTGEIKLIDKKDKFKKNIFEKTPE